MKTSTRHAGKRQSALSAALLWVSAALLLAGCGGGGSGSPPQHQSASLSYSPASLVLTLGTAATPVTPTVTGSLTSFTVAPALPPGLNLNSTTGVISGTPSAITPAATYTVSASGMSSAASASVSITVNDVPPSSVTYGSSAFTFTGGITARTLTPAASGGAVVAWSVNPALPAGLNFDPTDGAITGTPTTATAAGAYVVTAQNSGGQSTVSLTIEVDPGALLQLGHTASLSLLRYSGDRVLSLDESGHWVLWDESSGNTVASGDLGDNCAPSCGTSHDADLTGGTGGTLVLRTQTGFEVRDADSGAILSEIAATPAWWTLEPDGGYLSAGNGTGLSVWQTSGTEVVSRSGDYAGASAFFAPGDLYIANGPAGQNAIETVSVPSGTDTTGPLFNGTFNSWFLDSPQFLTYANGTAYVYSGASVQEAAITGPAPSGDIGQGNWVWTVNGSNLQIYPIASGSTPTATFLVGGNSQAVPSGSTIGLVSSGTGISIIDLSQATPSESSYTLPIVTSYDGSSTYAASPYAAISASQWVIGNRWGVLLDGSSLGGTPRYFDYGAVWSIAGSSGYIAVATASGSILYFDANTLAQVGTIADSASKIMLSSDGSVLAAAGDENDSSYHDDVSVNIYALPGAGLLYTWPYSYSGATAIPQDIELSASGAVLGQVLFARTGPSYTLETAPATGGAATFSNTFDSALLPSPPPLRISPDGTLAAISVSAAAGGNSGTSLYANGSLVTAVSGLPIGWIDNGHLLVNSYSPVNAYVGCTLYSGSGQVAGTCALPEVTAFQPIGPDSLFALNLASILSVSTGSVTWMSGDPISASVGAVAGSRVVTVSGNDVIVQGY